MLFLNYPRDTARIKGSMVGTPSITLEVIGSFSRGVHIVLMAEKESPKEVSMTKSVMSLVFQLLMISTPMTLKLGSAPNTSTFLSLCILVLGKLQQTSNCLLSRSLLLNHFSTQVSNNYKENNNYKLV